MFTFEQIKTKYPEGIAGRNPKALLVEYLQYELLDSIFKSSGSEHLSFIGGTAIRIIYRSGRFSEDLDFDNFGLSFRAFENLLGRAMRDMSGKGFETEFRFIEKGAYHCYIKFPDLLHANNLTDHIGEKVLIRVDAIRKKKLNEPQTAILNDFDIYRRVLVNAPEVILSQKIMTILQRRREKGRDLYDVSFLLGRFRPDYKYIEKSGGPARQDLKPALLEKIDSLDLAELARDAAPLLIKPEDTERILTFRQYIEQEL